MGPIGLSTIEVYAQNTEDQEANDEGGRAYPYQCYTHTIPCGFLSLLYEVWCVNATWSNSIIKCQCGLPPFNPCR